MAEFEEFFYPQQYDRIKEDAVKGFKRALTIDSKRSGRKLEAVDVWVDESVSSSDLKGQDEAVKNETTFGTPVYARLRLTDTRTGQVLSEAKKIKVATLPKNTDLGSFIVGGKHYQVHNQLRRRPGYFLTQRRNGEFKAEFHVAKKPFNIDFNAKDSTFFIRDREAKIPLYPVLSALGISDSALAKTWGEDVTRINKKKTKDPKKAVLDLAERFTREKYTDVQQAALAIKEHLSLAELDPSVTKQTLGSPVTNITPDVLLAGSRELLRANRGEREPDERNALQFKKIMSPADFIKERLEREDGSLALPLNRIRNKIGFKVGARENAPTDVKRLVSPNLFNELFETFFKDSDLAHFTDQTNPISMINGVGRTTIMGEGGVKSERAIHDDERGVHPSQLGFLDPIHTPDSSMIGVTGNLAVGTVKKGNTLYTPTLNTKDGKMEYLSPGDINDRVLGFMDQYDDAGKAKDRKVKAIKSGELTLVSPSEVSNVIAVPQQAFSIASNHIPFLASTHGVRAQASSKMLEQAVPLLHRDAPKVQSVIGENSIEAQVGTGFSVKAPVDGTVKAVKKGHIVLSTANGDVKVQTYDNVKLNKHSFLDSDAVVKEGDKVKKDDLLADSNFTRGGELAIGKDLRIAYIPYKGLNFEDGVVITESAARDLTSEHVTEYSEELKQEGTFSRQEYNVLNPGDLTPEQNKKLNEEGIVKKGAIVKKGDALWSGKRLRANDPTFRILGQLSGNLGKFAPFKNTWDRDVDGEVVDVVRKGNKVKVFVKTREPAVIGDKITQRTGGKGIITKIIPDGEAPHTKDGRPIDVLLNPHGVVSRMNPSQLLETAAGKVAEKNPSGRYLVNNFSGGNHAAEVAQALSAKGLKDTEELIDPETNKSLGEVLVGPQYILKLAKQAETQFSARSEGKYDVNEAPLKGGDDGSKSLDALTFYSMLAHGSRANLREMSTYKASKNEEFWNWLKKGSMLTTSLPPPEPTFAYKKFQAYMNGLGVDMKRTGSKMTLVPMTKREIGKVATKEVVDPLFLRDKDLAPERGGLMDTQIFGGRSLNEGNQFGYYKLAEPISNPVFEEPVKALTGLNDKSYKSIVQGKAFVDPNTGQISDAGVTGGRAIQVMLSKIDVKAEFEAAQKEAKTAAGKKNLTPLNKANKKLRFLRALQEHKVRPEEAYVLEKLPIIPPAFRQITMPTEGVTAPAPINMLYRDVGLLNNQLKWQNDDQSIPDEMRQPLREQLYDGVSALMGLGDPVGVYRAGRDPKGIISEIAGTTPKQGFFQSALLKKKQNLVGRGTIIPDTNLGVDEVGIPEDMAWEIFDPFVKRHMITAQGRTPIEALEEARGRTPSAKAALDTVMKDRPVMLNRAPSLHKFSIMAFKPKLTDGKAIKIPHLVVKGFGADFDGDAMNVHVPIMDKAVEEAWKMVPSNHLYNPGTGSIMLSPQNEAVLGLFQLSQNAEGKKAIMGALPEKLQKKYANVTLKKGNLNALISDLAKDDPVNFSKTIHKLRFMGEDQAYRSGFTVSLKDLLPQMPERDKITQGAWSQIKSETGLDFSDPAKKARALDILEGADKMLEGAVEKRLSSQGNNFYAMVHSGARGNMGQLKQVVSTPFRAMDHRGDVLPFIMKKSFAEGLDFSEYFSTTFGARAAAADKQLQTAEPGAFNKDIMASAITNVVSDADCGTDRGITMSTEKRGDLSDRYLASAVSIGSHVIAPAGTLVTPAVLDELGRSKVKAVKVRSPLTCKMPKGTCAKCFGINSQGKLPAIGDNIGAESGSSMSEPLTQMTLRTFHHGGAVGSRGIITGYAKIDKLMRMPQVKRGKATLSEVVGEVERVEDNPGGGFNVFVGKKSHFVEQGLFNPTMAQPGRKVTKGDILSDGLVQPKELVGLKGMLPAQEYIADQIQEAFESQKVHIKRRAIETVLRSTTNTTRVVDPGDSSFLAGDIAPYTQVMHFNEEGSKELSLGDAQGMALRKGVGGYAKGTVLDEAVLKGLAGSKVDKVLAGPRPIVHTPVLNGIEQIPMLRDDWMAQLGYRDLKGAIIGAASKGVESDIHNFSPVPAFVHGAEFGLPQEAKDRMRGSY